VNTREPHVGCGAAIVQDGRLLLVKRRKPPEAGCWNLPGGRVEWGEHAADAAKREIFEETGLEIEIVSLLDVVEMIGLDDQHWVSPTYLARVVAGVAENREPDRAEAVVWAPLDAPPQPLAMAARVALARLREARFRAGDADA